MTDSMAQGRFDSAVAELKHDDEIKQLSDSIENLRFSLSNSEQRK